jgi:hypothetical protein
VTSGLVLPTRETDPGLWAPAGVPHHHEPTPPNPREMSGGRGGGYGGLSRNAQGYVECNGIWWPLQGTDEGNPLQGGYGFGDKTDGGRTFHPGADGNAGGTCNADLGALCVAPCDGVVVAVLPWDGSRAGEGNHVWCYLDDPRAVAPAWMHWDHLQAVRCAEGTRFVGGQVLATCGNTGRWPCAHLHLELARERPASWWQWPLGWSLARMEATYYRPGWWFPASADKAGQTGQAGPGGPGQGEELPMDTTPEERAAMGPYFSMYGIAPNMETAIMKRACLAYKRDETPGPCLTDEYGWGDHGYVRQDFTCRVLEWHPDDGLVYYVETQLEARA